MQFQICNSSEVWVSVNRAEAHRIARKRTGALATMIRHARKAQKQESREYRRAEQELQNEIRESDRRNRALWKRIRVKPAERTVSAIERKPQAHKPTKTGWLANASQLPRYSGQIIDRMGRAGIFFRVRYYGHSTKAGVGRRSTFYIWEGAHETNDGRVMFASNVGETAEEAIAALEAVELFNREAQAGAKLLFHAIANVPYQLIEIDGGVERMFEIGQRFAKEQFGSRDLPFALALHPPSAEGDQRNWHLHIIFSTRPLIRTGDHEWDIGRMMRREIDSPEAFEEMRHLYARIQTEVVQEAGLNITYTALSNAERGLPNAPQKHLGAARAARVRRGERDEVNERNWETMLAGEAALLEEQLRHAQEQAGAEQALLGQVEARLTPLVADLAAAPSLTIAMGGNHAEPVAHLVDTYPVLQSDQRFAAPALPIANMQSRHRAIADLTRPQTILQSDARDVVGILPARSAVQSLARSIDVPSLSSKAADDRSGLPYRLSVPGVRLGHHHLARMTRIAEPTTVVSAPLPTIGPRFAVAGRAIAKPPALAMTPSAAGEISLSLGATARSVQRPLDAPKQSALADYAVDHDVRAVFRLLEARSMEVAARERARRERIAAERLEAERTRKAKEEQHARDEAETQRLEAEQALARQAERDAAEALEAMLKTIETERIFVPFDNNRHAFGDAVSKRFGITSAAIASGGAQARLDDIADRQRAEIEPVTIHAAANGGHIVQGDRGWTLSQHAPDHLRRIADAWVHEPLLQRAFAEAAAIFQKAQAKAQLTRPTEQAATTALRPSRRELLILAAQQRQAMTERWQQNRRFDQVHGARGHDAEIGGQRPLSPVRSQPRPARLDIGQDR